MITTTTTTTRTTTLCRYVSATTTRKQQQVRDLETQIGSTLSKCPTIFHAKQVHAHIIHHGLHRSSSFVVTKLVRTLTGLNVPVDTYPISIFSQVYHPNPFLYTALIRAYLNEARLCESVRLYLLMRRERVSPVSFTFSAFFKACGAAGELKLGMQFHAQTVLVGGFGPDLVVGNALIDMYLKSGALEFGRKVFDGMPVRDEISWTGLIDAYAKGGDMAGARELFDASPVKDMVSWTAMISGFAQNAMPIEAIQFFEKMQQSGVCTDHFTLSSVISACAQLGATKYADWVCDVAEKSGFGSKDCVVVGSALIDMYSKCGRVEDALKVFEAMRERNVFTYSSMILGFAVHGRFHGAMRLFNEMLRIDMKPNHVTFIGVLTACCHVGMVEQGRKIFESMEKHYGVKPQPDHYTCMVDLLGRAGLVKEALELVEKMPVEPHAGVWGALLAACRSHNNPEIAEIAASHLFDLEPKGIGNYVLLANIYSSAGMWNDVSRVRNLMRIRGIKKNPAFSWIETEKGVIHEFFAGDIRHPMSEQIKKSLTDLFGRLEAVGYQPNLRSVPYDVSNEEKRRILMAHSEKLALAFALVAVSPGYTIKIVKNLRICEDCHLVMCGASQVAKREIIVRDNMRFHHFRDGKCSCNNFW